LKGRESRTTNPKEYYDIISKDRLAKLIENRAVSDDYLENIQNFITILVLEELI
jgi:hypothetical protein